MARSGSAVSFAAALVAAAGMVVLAAGSAAQIPRPRLADTTKSVEVDVELVLAVDISYSMDFDELTLQREGYRLALTSPQFVRALRDGIHGKIAVTYFEWAGAWDQRTIVPWRLIDGPESAQAFADELGRATVRRSSRTSISGALLYAEPLFDSSGYRGIRRVVDVSGDGTNNQGPLVEPTRDAVLAAGITINGLAIMLKDPRWDIRELDLYYEDCVIGGPGAFVVPVRERAKFVEAIRTKLVFEIAGLMPLPRIIPASTHRPRIPCTIGEQLWQRRWGD